MSRVFVDGREYVPLPPAPNTNHTFGGYLSAARASSGMTQPQAADALGITVGWLDALERDSPSARELPFDLVVRVSALYHVSLDLLGVAFAHTRTVKVRGSVDDDSIGVAFPDDEESLPEGADSETGHG